MDAAAAAEPWLHIKHIKGYNGRIQGGLAAHPAVPGQCFYAAGSSVVTMFEADPNKQLQLRGHDDALTAFDLSPCGGLLATGQGGSNTDVVVWDTVALAQRFRFEEHDAEVCAVAFSHDSRLLATIGNERDRQVCVLDTATGGIVARSRLADAKRMTAVAWSPAANSASYAFATAAELEVALWGVGPHNALIHCDKVAVGSVRRAITCLAFSADGPWLFAGTAGGDVMTINVQRKAVQLMHSIAGTGIGCMRLLDATSLLVGTLDGTLLVFNTAAALSVQRASAASGAAPLLAPAGAVQGPISSISLTDGGAGALVGTRHGDIFTVALQTQQPGGSTQLARSGGDRGGAAAARPLLQSQQGALLDVCWDVRTPGSIVTTSKDGSVCAWDAYTLDLQCRVALPGRGASLSVAASPQLLLSGWTDGSIHCHSRLPTGLPGQAQTSGAALWEIPGAHARAHACGATAVRLSHRGHFIASGGAGGELRVWDLASREMACHLKHHSGAITDLKVLPHDAHLMAASEDRSWSIWDVGQEKVTRLFRASMGPVRGVDMAPDQVTAVSVGLDKSLCVWDVRQPGAPARLVPNAHLHEITCVAISRDGRLAATGGADCCIKLWELSSGGLLGTFAGHTATVNRLAFSPCDGQLASAGSDGAMVLWGVARGGMMVPAAM